MKFCKDCKRYRAEVNVDGGTLLPGFFQHIPAACIRSTDTDLVTGKEIYRLVNCEIARKSEEMCGQDAAWFEPATLDGRLAMLDDKA
jgi:hypothetical protein